MSESWLSIKGLSKTPKDLEPILTQAWDGYVTHTNWYFKHLNNSILRIGSLIVGELLLMKLFINEFGTTDNIFIAFTFLILSFICLKLMIIGEKTSMISFERSMDYIITVNKIIYAMGFGQAINIKHNDNTSDNGENNGFEPIPVKDDKCLYNQNLLFSQNVSVNNNIFGFSSSSQFAKYHTVEKKDGVAKRTKSLIYTLGGAGILIGILSFVNCILRALQVTW